jgi:GTPase SAR1 family protein
VTIGLERVQVKSDMARLHANYLIMCYDDEIRWSDSSRRCVPSLWQSRE